ncbi:pentatricopeptide repeat-containing protein At1g07740, mitochondrial [Rhododendron vialii]|uniref:pentatricopeptide repeat-containing protein At1g07740, mitochondrial n=1 Tax=Rhododendron vialii TaxID=182163 RepID=UPI00265EF6D8|nr:pentatricopeptide repeat-containing protein At1g07740, mitochondrial [Rhododendron vialii]
MITSRRSRSLNETLSTLLFHHSNPFTNHIRSLSYRPPRPTIPKPPHKPSKKLLPKPITFITDLKEIQNPDEALSLFNDYTQMGFKHDYPSYSSLIYKLARCRNFEPVKTLLHSIKHHNIQCREALFIGLIRHYGKSQLPEEAIDLFQQMASFNCVRTLQSFNTLLNVLVDNGRLEKVNEMFKCASKMGFKLNSVSFTVMIKGWLERGEWEQACRVFDEMLERGVEPSVVTYNCLVGYLCKKCDLDRAKGMLDDMAKKGQKPNAVTYSLLMGGLCSLDKYNEAKKMMFDMEYRGCKPQMVNYGVLMNDLAKRGLIEEAKALLHQMKKRRFKPDVVTYNILINYLCKDGRVAEAYKILVEMQVQGCEPNAATYRMMVDGFCRVKDFEGGLKLLNAMLASKHCPRLETFCCLIRGLAMCGKVDDVCFVLEAMEKKKMRFDLHSWEVLVREAFGEDHGSASSLVTELISAHQ